MGNVLFTGPKPPSGSQWCTYCAEVLKGYFLGLDWVQEKIQEINRQPEDDVIHMRQRPGDPPMPEIFPAVTMGMCQVVVPAMGPGMQPQLGVALAPICFAHIPGLVLKGGGMVAPATPQDVVLLSQKPGPPGSR